MDLRELKRSLGLKYRLNWKDRYFLKNFPRRINNIAANEQKAIDIKFVEIFSRESIHVTDEQSQGHLLMCSYMLASYEVLSTRWVGCAVRTENVMDTLRSSLDYYHFTCRHG